MVAPGFRRLRESRIGPNCVKTLSSMIYLIQPRTGLPEGQLKKEAEWERHSVALTFSCLLSVYK